MWLLAGSMAGDGCRAAVESSDRRLGSSVCGAESRRTAASAGSRSAGLLAAAVLEAVLGGALVAEWARRDSWLSSGICRDLHLECATLPLSLSLPLDDEDEESAASCDRSPSLSDRCCISITSVLMAAEVGSKGSCWVSSFKRSRWAEMRFATLRCLPPATAGW